MVENIVGNSENAGNQHSLSPFLTMLTKAFYFRVVETENCMLKGKLQQMFWQKPNLGHVSSE